MKKTILAAVVGMTISSAAIASGDVYGNNSKPSAYDRKQDEVIGQLQQNSDNVQSAIDAKVDKSVFEADQARQDGKINQVEQSVSEETSARIQQGNDLKADIDTKVSASDFAASQREQDSHITAVEVAAQTANDRATSLESRADASEQAIRDVQNSAQTANDRSTALEQRADNTESVNAAQDGQIAENKSAIELEAKNRESGDSETLKSANGYTDAAISDEAQKRVDGDAKTLESANSFTSEAISAQAGIQNGVDAEQNKAIASNSSAIQNETAARSQQFTQLDSGVKQAQATGEYAHSRIDAANANIEANRQALVNTNKRVADNTAAIAGHEQRLTTLEQQTSAKFSDLKRQIDDNRKEANAGIAGVAAMANIPQVTDKQDFSVGAGVGFRGDEQAVAVGFSGRVTENVVTKVAVSTDTQNGWTVGAGVSYGW